MKTQTTKRSICVVTFLGLLTSFISVALVRYAAAEDEPSFLAAPAGGDAVTVWNANAGVAATAACLAPLNNPLHESRIYAMMHVAKVVRYCDEAHLRSILDSEILKAGETLHDALKPRVVIY